MRAGGGEGGVAGGEVALVVVADGSAAEVKDASLRCWIFATPQGVFRFTLSGDGHGAAQRVGDLPTPAAKTDTGLLGNLALDYAIEARAGTFTGRLNWHAPDAVAAGVDAAAYHDRVMATLACYTRRYVSTPELRIELADAAQVIPNDILATLAEWDLEASSSENDDTTPASNPIVELLVMYQ